MSTFAFCIFAPFLRFFSSFLRCHGIAGDFFDILCVFSLFFFGSFNVLLGIITKFLVGSMPFSGKPLLPTGSPRLKNISRTYRFFAVGKAVPRRLPFFALVGRKFSRKKLKKRGFRFVKNKELYKKLLFCKERGHKNRNKHAKFSSNRCGRGAFCRR